MRKVLFLFLVSMILGCGDKYIPLSDNLIDEIKVEMYNANKPEYPKTKISVKEYDLKTIEDKPFLTNKNCTEIMYSYDSKFGIYDFKITFADDFSSIKKGGDTVVLKINDIIVNVFVVDSDMVLKKAFGGPMKLDELEKYVKDKNKIYYDKIAEIEKNKGK